MRRVLPLALGAAYNPVPRVHQRSIRIVNLVQNIIRRHSTKTVQSKSKGQSKTSQGRRAARKQKAQEKRRKGQGGHSGCAGTAQTRPPRATAHFNTDDLQISDFCPLLGKSRETPPTRASLIARVTVYEPGCRRTTTPSRPHACVRTSRRRAQARLPTVCQSTPPQRGARPAAVRAAQFDGCTQVRR